MDTSSNDDERGYVGIEYIIKYISKRTNEMVYECLMCGLILPTQGMQSHVLGYQHRSKYLNLHFPTLSGDIRNYVDDDITNVTRVKCRVFDEVCAAIERHHGRQIPKQYDESIVERERNRITNEVLSLRHASESNGPMFIDLINKMKVDRFIKEADNTTLEPLTCNTNHQADFDSVSKYKETSRPRFERYRENKRSDRRTDRSDRSRERSGGRDLSRDRDRSRDYRHSRERSDSHRYRERSRSRDRHRSTSNSRHKSSNRYGTKNPINLNLYDNPPLSDDAHKKLVEEFLQQTIEKSNSTRTTENDRNKKNLCQIPIEEDLREKLDRNRRAESLSPYRPNDIWQTYRRMFDQAVISINDEYKSYRDDPERHPEYNSEWRAFWCKRKEELTNDGIDYRNHDFQVEWIDFFKKRIEGLFEEDVEKIKINLRKQLDLPIDNKKNLVSKYMLKEPVEESVNCLSVLRILTALENDLGSLGPKAVDLMTKALTLEKISAGGSDKLLNDDNCTFFETVNEKLKGLVLVLGLEGSKLTTVTNVISNIEVLISQASKQRSSSSNDYGQKQQSQSDTDFKKLSLGLAAKGKNVDSEKIKEIISLYNLLSNSKKAKDESGDKNKSLSATLNDFLSSGSSKDTKHGNPSVRQETAQQVSSTSEISIANESSFDRFSSEFNFNTSK